LERKTPDAMAKVVADLRRDGIAILQGFLTGERLASCQLSFEQIVDMVRTSPPPPEQTMPWRYGGIKYREYEYRTQGLDQTSHLNPLKFSKPLLDLSLDEFLLGIVARYFNRKFKLYEADICRIHPGEPVEYSSWQWHHDGLGPLLKIMVWLTDVGPNDMSTSYLKGTHRIMHGFEIHNGKTRISKNEVAQKYAGFEQINATGPAGTVLIFDPNGVHRGNRRPTTHRDHFCSCYCPGGTNWPVTVNKKHLEGLSPAQLDVLFRNPLAHAE
jgi:hypothetical protein